MSADWHKGDLPSWGIEFDRALRIYPQFVLSGNIRDRYYTNISEKALLLELHDALWEILSNRGCEFLLVYDPVANLRVHRVTEGLAGLQYCGLSLNEQTGADVTKQRLAEIMRLLALGDVKKDGKIMRGALVIDYASRLAIDGGDSAGEANDFFMSSEKLSHLTNPLPVPSDVCPYNSIIWVVNQPSDLPGWLLYGNESIRHISAGLPDSSERRGAIRKLLGSRLKDGASQEMAREQSIVEIALRTEGMTIKSLQAINDSCEGESLELSAIKNAIRFIKVGISNDPWKDAELRKRIADGHQFLESRVKGQRLAINHAMDTLTRSIAGLSGAQSGGAGGRPRGVLFFAGPTGVGKTELAKAITELLFGDETACHRFDMSEFSAEHSDARLIGAPPGYTGYDSGGELVNAVRQRPFSVLLFDEIEKAHQKILDKFLQILEDGRLTDGRGITVHFSESVIVFTSNLGIIVERDGKSMPNVKYGEEYPFVASKVKAAIEDHFRLTIQRPELLNRIGMDNIIVFDFVREKVAVEIFEKMLGHVIKRVRDANGIELSITDTAKVQLQELCFTRLYDGGRGIGNQLESRFVNPLARALFAKNLRPGEKAKITALVVENDRCEVELE